MDISPPPPDGGLPEELLGSLDTAVDSPPTLVALDFDGVLAPIVEHRDDARPLPGSMSALQRLAARPGVHLAVLSGRTLRDLGARSDFPPGTHLVGSHGAEFGDADVGISPTEAANVQRLGFTFESLVRDHPGTELETKPIGVALHTRLANRQTALAATAAAVLAAAQIPGANITVGKEVVDVSVATTTKGHALTRLRTTLLPQAMVYIGDDVSDESAFAAMSPTDVSIKVGPGNTAARFRVDGPDDVQRVLERLADTPGMQTPHSATG